MVLTLDNNADSSGPNCEEVTVIDLEISDGVAFITLNAPATGNALNNELAEEFVQACEAVDRDRSVGAAVISGAGGTFCSGAERGQLDELGRDPAEEGRYAALGGIYRAFTRVGQLEVPTIAAVCGAAVGAGINLMLATDLRIVAEDARLISGFLRIGLHPGGGHFGLLAGRTGTEAAAAAGLFGEEISGLRAVQLGLAWQALPSEAVRARAAELARRPARDPELARKATASLRIELGPPRLPWAAALEVERGAQLWSLRRRSGHGE
jgi:enoyl-CoA hydratase